MVFSSFSFLLVFLPAVLACYYAVPGARGKKTVLCLFSLVFYAWGEPVYVLLMIASVLANYFLGLAMERYPKGKKPLLALSLALNLGALGYFKYADFLLSNINGVFSFHLPLVHVALPIGISFYTFQILSYVIDVYRGNTAAQHSLLSLTTYIAMFPQLVAGPIVRYGTVREELLSPRVSLADFSDGLCRFLFGLGKKVLIANQMARAADAVFDAPGGAPGAALWIGALCYTMQIYFDFSGYSDMAIGLGHIFGFHFLENFHYPYVACSVTEFWRRWHISLSSWFREYVYIPLGGNRKGVSRQILNMLIVWLLTGLWHGASWNFLLWGLYYALLLILEKHLWGNGWAHLPTWVRRPCTFFLVVMGWVLFRVEDLGRLGQTLAAMFTMSGGGAGAFFMENANALSPLLLLPVALIGCLPVKERILRRLNERKWLPGLRRTAAFLIWLVSLAMLLGETYNPFIYFRF